MSTLPTPGKPRIVAAAAPNKDRYYKPELDAVRFFAFFLVFLHHDIHHQASGFDPHFRWATQAAAFSNACGFGMGLFFALSAYLICELLLREKERSATIALKSFYIRRALRIWPLYFLGILIGCLFALWSHQFQDLALFGAFALMVGNWFLVLVHSTANPMVVLWSISVEEQFYLFCPLTIRALTRRGLYFLCGAILVVSNIVLYVLGNRHADTDIIIWCNGLVQFQFFAAGMLISLLMRGKVPTIPGSLRIGMILAALPLWFVACYTFHAKQIAPAVSGPTLIAGYALATIGCVLVLLGFLGAPARAFPAWAIFLGKISFGLYVYHVLAMMMISSLPAAFMAKGTAAFLIRTLGKLVLTIALAALSYRFFEARFLRLKQKFEVVKSRPV